MEAELVRTLDFVWLEITGKCPLQCEHCYNESGPKGTHGTMTTRDWLRVIGEVRAAGARRVQFIGGEPTLHPDLAELINAALRVGLEVEVFTNLVHIPWNLWLTLAQDGVKIATSYYSDDAQEHDAITGGPASWARTTANIARVLAEGIPLRVEIVGLRDGQRHEQARARLVQMGVDPAHIGFDHLREVGRGERTQKADASQLCGHCASDVLAVLPDGTVTPCVFSRWLDVGNVLTDSLAEIEAGEALAGTRADLNAGFVARGLACAPSCNPGCNPSYGCRPGGLVVAACAPDHCHPASPAGHEQPCNPDASSCGPHKSPPALACHPSGTCGPCRPYAPAEPSVCLPCPPRGGQLEAACRPGGTCGPGHGCSPNCSPP